MMKFKLVRSFFCLSTLSFVLVRYYFYPKPKNESKYNGSRQEVLSKNETKNEVRQEELSNIENGKEDSLSKWMTKMEKRFSQRAAMVKSACEKYNVKSPYEIQLQYGHFQKVMFDTYFKWGFCAVGKVASTTLSYQFKKLMTTKERPNSFNKKFSRHWITEQMIKFFELPAPLVQQSRTTKYSKSIDTPKLINFLEENDYLLFTFVRHPFERLISAFKEKILNPHRHVPSDVKPQLKILFEKANSMSFPEFIDLILTDHQECRKSGKTPNGHWNTFSNMCLHCTIPYDVIGQLETFNEDLKYIILKLGLQNILPIDNIDKWQKNKSDSEAKDKKKEVAKYLSQLTKAKLEELLNIYRLDLEMFSYDVSDYLDLS